MKASKFCVFKGPHFAHLLVTLRSNVRHIYTVSDTPEKIHSHTLLSLHINHPCTFRIIKQTHNHTTCSPHSQPNIRYLVISKYLPIRPFLNDDYFLKVLGILIYKANDSTNRAKPNSH
jgi:hypothetical protein